jgi:hypothetical protein
MIQESKLRQCERHAMFLLIEASPRQAAGNLHRKDDNFLDIRSLTPQQATGNALAYAVHLILSGIPLKIGWFFH